MAKIRNWLLTIIDVTRDVAISCESEARVWNITPNIFSSSVCFLISRSDPRLLKVTGHRNTVAQPQWRCVGVPAYRQSAYSAGSNKKYLLQWRHF